MNILGINCGLHDASACLVKDGKIIAFSAEERHSRKKHDGRYPANAIKNCIDWANLTYADMDAVAYSWDYFKYETEKLIFHIRKTLEMAQNGPDMAIDYLSNMLKRKEKLYDRFNEAENETRKLFDCEFVKVDHHLAHVFSAFPLSGFPHSALLIVDGSGEMMCTSLWHHSDGALKLLKSYDLPHSLGVFYAAITQFLGFVHHDEEWKVMGWAPYGTPKYEGIMKKVLSPENMQLNLDYFQFQNAEFPWYSEKLVQELGLKPREKNDGFDAVYSDVAASAQKVLEDCILTLAKEVKTLTNEDNLCMAGGVALNGKANGYILENGIFRNLFVQPASADDGTSVGAALKVAYDKGENIVNPLESVFYGSGFQNQDYQAALHNAGLQYEELDDPLLFEKIVSYLNSGKIVGWFQGRSEMGPRALGNRSILADPRREDTKDILNSKIKFREPFRPFAPSVLAEYANEYFEGNTTNAFFMNQIFKVKKEKWSVIPAVTHEDKTSRIQMVTRDGNRRYYELIEAFYKMAGVPLVVNTSFNVKGEPIVDTPEEAVRCFLNTGIDMLVMGNLVSTKEKD